MADAIPNDLDSGDIPPDSVAAILSAFALLDQHMLPHLRSAGTDDQRNMMRMGEKNEPFVGKVSDYLETNPEFMPSYANKDGFKAAVSRVNALKPFQRRLDQYKSMVDDTVSMNGGLALEGALPYYTTTREAAKRKQPAAVTIYQDLRTRFIRKRPAKPAAPAAAAAKPADPSSDKD